MNDYSVDREVADRRLWDLFRERERAQSWKFTTMLLVVLWIVREWTR